MEIQFDTVFERDMDLFIMNEFISDKEFAALFLDKVYINNYEIIRAVHSHSDKEYGESDIEFIVEDSNHERHGILIEDKINAIDMPNQCSRYSKRGSKGILNKDYDYFHIFITAPESYLDHNNEAKKYSNKVSYEEMKEYFITKNDCKYSFKIAVINQAIEKKKNGFNFEEDIATTDFWIDYYNYQSKYHPELELMYSGQAKPKNQTWFEFKTYYKNLSLVHKADRGYIDLQFAGYGKKIDKLKTLIGIYLDEDMRIVQATKSASVRMNGITIKTCKDGFECYKDEIDNDFDNLLKLYKFISKLDYKKIYSE
jgi:hypothetical protein